MAANTKHPPGPPTELANMREQGVRNLIGYCLNDACRHSALIDVSDCSERAATDANPVAIRPLSASQ